MASLTIRNVDDVTKQTLRIRAARHGVSMEEEARRILAEALVRSGARAKLGRRLVDRFAGASSDEFVLPSRQMPRDVLQWDEPA
ncbi:MAG: plasmid stabilization protein [Armatimonadetes bacterium]|nr:plasmid stabilization protein [Armatimonadota bacterium]